MRRIVIIMLITSCLISLCACSRDKKELTVDTMGGTFSANDVYNWTDYEDSVLKKVKLDKSIIFEIDEKISKFEEGTLTEAETNMIIQEYGDAKEYKEYLLFNARKQKVMQDCSNNIKITDSDRQLFIENYTSVFGGKNAVIIQSSSVDILNECINLSRHNGTDAVLNYVKSKINKDITWENINDFTEESGIYILHNAESNKYNYCLTEQLSGIFNTLSDGELSEVFNMGDMYAAMYRISDNTIEKDDTIIDKYMTKIKIEEAYKKYIIENK